MYIQKLKVENLRGIGEGARGIELDLRRPDGSCQGWTVLAGRNGSGKTTLLQAIAVALAGPRALNSPLTDFSAWRRQGAGEGRVELTLGYDAKLDKFQGKGKLPKNPFAIGLRWPLGADKFYAIKPLHESAATRGPWNEKSGWFVAGYGPFRRLSGHSSDAASLMSSGGAVPELVTLFREDASLAEGIQALRTIYLRRMEGKEGAKELEVGMIALLNDGLLPDGTRVEEVNSDAVWVSTGAGVRLPLGAISDGQRAAVALVLDILAQMSRFFPGFHIKYTAAGRPFVPYSGVILLDEAEPHLHVSWQKGIGFWLKEHFPKIQFLVTTHSPFVCQAADPNGLIRLRPAPDEPAAEPVSEEEYNRVVNDGADSAVVTSLFGLESPYSQVAEKRRERISQLEAKQLQGLPLKTAEATELAELQRQIPSTPSAGVEAALRRLKEAL
ncbi:MAG: AAA family ATPase [Polyangia bacterium]